MATAFTAKEYYQYLKYNKKSKINRYVFSEYHFNSYFMVNLTCV